MLFACDLPIKVQIPALKGKGSEYFSVTFWFIFPVISLLSSPLVGLGFCLVSAGA